MSTVFFQRLWSWQTLTVQRNVSQSTCWPYWYQKYCFKCHANPAHWSRI